MARVTYSEPGRSDPCGLNTSQRGSSQGRKARMGQCRRYPEKFRCKAAQVALNAAS